MRKRAETIGAALDIQGAAGKGTEITAVWKPEAGAIDDKEQHDI